MFEYMTPGWWNCLVRIKGWVMLEEMCPWG